MTIRNYFRLLAEDQLYGSRWSVILKMVFTLASWCYGLGMRIRNILYASGALKQHSFPCPVISIGNITWGGTGKTPIVEYVSRFYLNRRKTPLILTRGYGQDESKVLPKQLPDAQFGIGPDRIRTAKEVMSRKKVDVIVLDDAFQHWNIKRDMDIVTINVLNPFGNFSLIPRGILREPVESLKRASLIVLTDVNLTPRKTLEALKTQIRKWAPNVDFLEAHREALYFYRPESRERIPVDKLQGERVTVFSGIGTPRSFLMLLNQLGLKTVRNFEFSDHHPYTERELKDIVSMKESSESEEIITTEKDFYRSEGLMRKIIKPLILKVRLRLTAGETTLHQYLSRYISGTVSNVERVQPPHQCSEHPHFEKPAATPVTLPSHEDPQA